MRPPDCRIYIDTELGDTELLGIVTEAFFARDRVGNVELDLFKNDDYHTERRMRFPDGFVHFRFYLDLYLGLTDAEAAKRVGALLDELWAQGMAAVAGCRFEHLLPEHGGYRSERVPWPDV